VLYTKENSEKEEVMPVYEYKCAECGHCLEVMQTFSQHKNSPSKVCPECGKEALHQIFGRVYVHYKGPGFHTTESRGITGRKRKPNIKVGMTSDLPPEEREKYLG